MRRSAAVALLTLAVAACQPAAARVEATYRVEMGYAPASYAGYMPVCGTFVQDAEKAVARTGTYTMAYDIDAHGCTMRVRMDEDKQTAVRAALANYGYVRTSTTADSMTGGAR